MDNNQQTTIAQDIEQLIKKASAANTEIISETARFLQQLSTSKLSGENVASLQKQLFSDAVNLFVKLNIQHTANLIDMGVAISKHLNQQFDKQTNTPPVQQEPQYDTDKPAFELNATCQAGGTATAEFLLNSDKKDPVLCHLMQTSFALEGDPSVQNEFETTFLPQSFQLLFGKPQRVEIKIKLPAATRAGVYRSHIRVHGFEHTFFDLLLNVTPQQKTVPKAPASKSAGKPATTTPQKKSPPAGQKAKKK
ncbi:MAG: hypothetical protein IPJ82_12105 [Lewinellaceae bacterium]|nr:hypothetical protein [Lewinellaceae bacterium]